MIARNLVVIGEQGSAVSAGDWIAGLSVVVAALAFGFTIWAARAQIRHNQLSAKPHMDVGVGTLDFMLRITNHGPGVACIEAYKANIDGNEFDLLDVEGPEKLFEHLSSELSENNDIRFEVLSKGDYLASGASSVTIAPIHPFSQIDRDRFVPVLKRLRVDVTTKCFYGLTHKSTYSGFGASPHFQ